TTLDTAGLVGRLARVDGHRLAWLGAGDLLVTLARRAGRNRFGVRVRTVDGADLLADVANRVLACRIAHARGKGLVGSLRETQTGVLDVTLGDVVINPPYGFIGVAGPVGSLLLDGHLAIALGLLSGGDRVDRAEHVLDGGRGPDDDHGPHQHRTDDLAAEAGQAPRGFAPAGRGVWGLHGVRKYHLARGGGL